MFLTSPYLNWSEAECSADREHLHRAKQSYHEPPTAESPHLQPFEPQPPAISRLTRAAGSGRSGAAVDPNTFPENMAPNKVPLRRKEMNRPEAINQT